MSELRKYRSEKRQLLWSLWCCLEYRKENSMDQERRIKDLEDKVRRLNIMLMLVSVALAFNAFVNLKVSTSIWNSIDIICSRLNQFACASKDAIEIGYRCIDLGCKILRF